MASNFGYMDIDDSTDAEKGGNLGETYIKAYKEEIKCCSSLAVTRLEDFESPKAVSKEAINPRQENVSLDNFELLKLLGKGSFAKVFQVQKKDGFDKGAVFAMKILNKASIRTLKEAEHVKSERTILEQVRHPFVVNLKYAFQTDSKLYMIMEYLGGGDLFTYLQRESLCYEESTCFYISEIVLALEYLHSKQIVYRDLKPENVMLDGDGHVKLTDFGLSKNILKEGVTYTFCGTLDYMAPEVILGIGYGKEADWWSLGAVMFDMMTGVPPFKATNRMQAMQRINSWKLNIPRYIPKYAKALMKSLMRKTPNYRLGALPIGAAEIKAHPFFWKICWDDVLLRKYEPPFKPNLKNFDDVSQFDTTFTTQTVTDSPAEPVVDELHMFHDFSYTSPSFHEQ